MYLTHFRTLIHKLLNKDQEIVTKETPLNILDKNSDVCWVIMVRIPISRKVNFVSNG